jgi:hypothetical protein
MLGGMRGAWMLLEVVEERCCYTINPGSEGCK